MYQAGRFLQSIDDAKKGRGDVVDSFGRVLFRDTLHGFVWEGVHKPVSDAHVVMAAQGGMVRA